MTDHQSHQYAPTPIEAPYDMLPVSQVSVEVDPVLTVDGYPRAARPASEQVTYNRQYRRQQYWTEGDGARRFLQEMANKLNASPHLRLQPFEVSMTWGTRESIVARLAEFTDEDDADVARVILDYADSVAEGLLAELVREQRWQNLERIGREPVPLNYPTYTGGQNSRGGPFDLVVGRTSQAVASKELAKFKLENKWVV